MHQISGPFNNLLYYFTICGSKDATQRFLKVLFKEYLQKQKKPSVNNLMFLKNLIIFTKANFIVTKCNEIRFFFSLRRKKYLKLYTCGVVYKEML